MNEDKILIEPSRFYRILKPLTSFFDRLSWLVLFCMMLLTVSDVLCRKLLSKSILGTVEITEMMMIVTVFFSLAQTELLNGHIKVDLVLSRLTPKAQACFDLFTQLCCALLFGAITVSTLRHASGMRDSGEVTLDLLMPVWPFVYVVALGCALLTLALLLKFLQAVHEAVR